MPSEKSGSNTPSPLWRLKNEQCRQENAVPRLTPPPWVGQNPVKVVQYGQLEERAMKWKVAPKSLQLQCPAVKWVPGDV